MLNYGKKKYSNSCVVRKKNSERNKNHNPPPLLVKWSVPKIMLRKHLIIGLEIHVHIYIINYNDV